MKTTTFKFLTQFIYKYRLRYFVGILSLILVDALDLAIPKLTGDIVDKLKSGAVIGNQLLTFVALLIGVAVMVALFRYVWTVLVLGTARKIERDVRSILYKHLQSLSPSFYDRNSTGSLMAYATNDADNIRLALGQGMALIFDSFIIPVFAFVLMIATGGPKIALLCIAPLLLLAGVFAVFTKVFIKSINNMQDALSDMTEATRENISGIRIIKAFANELTESQKYHNIIENVRKKNIKYALLMSNLFPLVMSIAALSFAVMLTFGGIMVINKELTLGNFVAFNGYLILMIWPMAALGWTYSLIQRGFASAGRIIGVLNEIPDIKESLNNNSSFSSTKDEPIHESVGNNGKSYFSGIPEDDAVIGSLTELKGNIEVRNLSFMYPESTREVIMDINLSIEAGKSLGILGMTGSGKSTLLSLLLRMYNFNKGEILYEGIPIHKIPVGFLRKSFGVVPQDTFLFSASVAENIDFLRGRSMDEIINAAKIAMIHDEISALPKGYDTILGERGITLSGGQKQRVAIARSILDNPGIVIFDDCLSAVDTKTEEAILKGLKNYIKERTSIIVSHRIATIKDCDEIIVLIDGRITERGTHGVLAQADGFYQKIYRKQQIVESME